jgi:uncharacterized membrane protein YfcA
VTDLATIALVGSAGLAAGAINTVVGSGTLITFPVLLALGVPPVTANVSNTIGLVPGTASGAWSYRGELAGQRGRLIRLGSASLLGGIAGGLLLLSLPAGVFKAVVPVLIILAVGLVVAQPWLSRRLTTAEHHARIGRARAALLWCAVLLTGVYGGYFGAAQGVLLIAILGILLEPDLQTANALKNVLAGLVNGIAGVIFIILAHPDWTYVAIIAAGSTLGGQIGGLIGRRLSPVVLRGIIVIVGIAALVKFLLG